GRAEHDECLERLADPLSSVEPPPFAAQALAVAEERARALERTRIALVVAERPLELVGERRCGRQQAAAARRQRQRVWRVRDLHRPLESLEFQLGVAAPA